LSALISPNHHAGANTGMQGIEQDQVICCFTAIMHYKLKVGYLKFAFFLVRVHVPDITSKVGYYNVLPCMCTRDITTKVGYYSATLHEATY